MKSKLLMKYEKDQTPIERLRNLLTPLVNMSELLFLLKSQNKIKIKDPDLEKLIFDEVEKAQENNSAIKNYLSDAETLYLK